MNIIKFLASLFPQPTSLQLKETREFSKALLQAQERHKRKEAQEQLAIEVHGFIDNSELSKLLAYLNAGYPLSLDDMTQIGMAQEHWLLDTASPSLENYAVQPAHISVEEKAMIGQFRQHVQAKCPTVLFDFMLERLTSLNKFTNHNLKQTQRVLLRVAQGIHTLEQYHTFFTKGQDKILYDTYQEEVSSLKYWNTHGQKAKSQYPTSWTEIAEHFNQSLQLLEAHMKQHYGALLQSDFLDKISQVRAAYQKTDTPGNVEDIQVALKGSIEKKIDSFQKSSIPPEAWIKIEAIQTQGQKLLSHTAQLSMEDNFEIKNLTGNVLLELIQEYVVISPEHKAHLKNETGQGLDELFMESLTTIEEKLLSQSQNLAQSQFKEVKITHQYLKTKR